MIAIEGEKPVVVAAGMDFEARIAQGAGISVVYGQNRCKYIEVLHTHAKSGACGIISFGIAGGLSPHLRPGDIVVANAAITAKGSFPACPAWARSLLGHLPQAHHLPVFGADAPVLTTLEKECLWKGTGAGVVDLESGTAAEVAALYDLPYAALRIVLDPSTRAVPLSALAGARDDGKTDALAVIRALIKRPKDLPGLLRLAGDSRKANQSLLRSRQALGPLFGFGLFQPGKLALDVE